MNGAVNGDVILYVQGILQEIKEIHFKRRIGIIFYPFVIGYFIVKEANAKLSIKTKELLDIEQKIIEKYRQVNKDLEYLLTEIESKDTYLIFPLKSKYLNQCKFFHKEISFFVDIEAWFSEEFQQFARDHKKKILDIYDKLQNYNELFIKRRKVEYESLFSLGPFPLDDEQKTAIITDDKYNLVVAGAGSGKTEVLTTRIGLWDKINLISPSG